MRRAFWLAAVIAIGYGVVFSIAGRPATLSSQGPKAEPHQSRVEAVEMFRQADEAMEKGDYQTAIKILEAACEVYPESVPAWFNLAYAYSVSGLDAEAIRAYEQTLKLQPDLFEAHLNLGILLSDGEKLEAAQAQLEEALALKPDHARAHYYYGRTLLKLGKSAEAMEQLKEAIRLDKGLAPAHFELGRAYLAQGNFNDALLALQSARQADPQAAEISRFMAVALDGLNRLDEAAAEFERYLTTNAEDAPARFRLADIYYRLGKHTEGLAHLQILHQHQTPVPDLAKAMGRTLAALKRYDEAEQWYRQALVLSPRDTRLRCALGDSYLHQDKLQEAEAEYRAVLQVVPGDPEASRGLALSLYLQKRYGEAIPILENQVQAGETSAGLFFTLATSYDHLQAAQRAIEYYEKFIAASAGHDDAREWQARQRIKALRRKAAK